MARKEGAGGTGPAPSFSFGFVLKLLFLAAVNGIAIVALPRIVEQKAWVALTAVVVATVAMDVIYLGKRRLPGKYIIPGTIFLVMFQLYPALYTFYISFTNYSTGHVLSKEQAIGQIEANSEQPVEGGQTYQARPLANDQGALAILLTNEQGEMFLGTSEGLDPVDPSEVHEVGAGQVQVRGFGQIGLGDPRANDVLKIRVPTGQGSIRLISLGRATTAQKTLQYDPATDTMTDVATGESYRPFEGNFLGPDGRRLSPGWQVVIGPRNFTRVFTSSAIRGPFVRVFIWNYLFAVLSVFTTFALGLALALTLNKEGLGGRRIYRSLLVIPYAVPSFLSALIWAGLLNTSNGAVNRMLGSAHIQWLNDPFLAKASVLMVNTWLGFPYMFLISTGALQSIPDELLEAAAVDGARPWTSFRTVKLPLLLTSIAPLLIASFAFNFNNFNVIYLLTRGGPPIVGAQTPAGHTDILISYTYRLAFESGRGQDFAFAAAISILIFVMVGTISAISFRATRTFEQAR